MDRNAVLIFAFLALAATASGHRSLTQAPPASSTAGPPNPRNGGPPVGADASIVPPQGQTVKINWRGVGTQNYTSGSNGQYAAGGAVANLFLQNATNIVGKHYFVQQGGGILPAFERVDPQGNSLGIIIANATATMNAPNSNDNGGYGSIPWILLKTVSANGFFQGINWIQRINTNGGTVPGNPKLFTLPASPTGVANFPLCVPYQADYLFYQGSASAPASG